MINKINITESEKNNILTLHKILNEATGLSIGGEVLSFNGNEPIYAATVSLTDQKNNIKNTKTDDKGRFIFQNLESGRYTITCNNKTEGYTEKTEQVVLENENILDLKILMGKGGVLEVIEAKPINVFLTTLDFYFIDSNSKPIPNVTFTLKNNLNQIGEFNSSGGESRLTFNGADQIVKPNEPLTYDVNEYNKFFYTKKEGNCVDNKKITVIANAEGYGKNKQKFDFCLKNSRYIVNLEKSGSTVTVTPANGDNGIPKKIQSQANSNVFKMVLSKPNIGLNIKTLNNLNEVVPNVKIVIYSDETKTKILKTITTDNKGLSNLTIVDGDIELFNDDNDQINKVELYFEVKLDRYNEYYQGFKLKNNQQNEVSIRLISVKEPKEMNVRQCIKFTKDYYDNLVSVYNKSKTIQDLGGNGAIVEARNQVEACYVKYKKFYIGNVKKIVNKLTNVPPSLDIFELTFTFDEQKSIYKESTDMGMHNTILKVISEQSEKKSLLIKEGEIVESRLKFILNQSTKKTLRNNIIKEGNELISKGYDKKIVKEISLKIFHLNGI
jgi:hypothetical protein